MKKWNPIFLRYLLILFLFSALMLIMFVPVYYYIFSFTLKSELAYIFDRFHWGVSSLDASINAVNNAAILTNRDSRFRIFTQRRQDLAANPVLLNELRGHFNGLLLSFPVIEDAGIIFSPEVILTREQIVFSPLIYPFYGNYLRCKNLSMDGWFELIAKTNSFQAVQSYESMNNRAYEGLTYSVQWKETEDKYSNLIYATFSVKKILLLLMDEKISSQSFIRIFDNSNVLFEYAGERWNPKEKIRVLADKSAITATSFELMLPESVISGQMKAVFRLMFIFTLSAVFFAFCLSLFFAYKWSEPMRRLLFFIDTTKIFKNEYEQNIGQGKSLVGNYFRRFYTGLSDSIQFIDNKLENSLQAVESRTLLLREQIFYKALYQGIYTEQDEQLFLSLFTGFPSFFQLGLVDYDRPESSSLQDTAAFQLRLIKALKHGNDDMIIQAGGDNAVVLFLPLQEKNDSWYTKLLDLRNSLNQYVDLALRFSLGAVYEKPADISRAWQELQFIRAVSRIENLVSIGQVNDIQYPQKRLPLSITTLQVIYNALNNGNDTMACNVLAECTADLTRGKDRFIWSFVAELLRNALILLKRENPVVLVNVEIPQYIPNKEIELFTILFPECFCRIANLIKLSREENASRFGNRILDFINQNLYNSALYSTLVQDEFNISQPTLQKIIKQLTGHTFLSYVETCRLERAKELLSKGISTIREISEQCGFSNTNSFYKAFRRFYGFPPSDVKNKPKFRG